MAELADALDLGSSGRPCRFDSCYPQHKALSYWKGLFSYFIRILQEILFRILMKYDIILEV